MRGGLDQDRIAGGIRLGDDGGSDTFRSTAAVLDDDRLTELRRRASSTMRPTMSSVLPAVNGIMARIGLLGQLWPMPLAPRRCCERGSGKD